MKEQDKTESEFSRLPARAAEFIRLVIKKMRYRKKVRADVMAELSVHFEDELKDCKSGEEKEQKAQQLIADFGDVKLLAVLLRRAKKRCRPLWRTIVARTFQTIGVLILCFILYTAWFLTGEPIISVDYLALLNQMNRPHVSEEDNAWPHYAKAIELSVEPGEDLKKMAAFKNYKEAVYRDFGNLTEVEQKEIRKWVEQNKAAWQKFVEGSLKTYCYREYETKDEEKWLWTVLMPHLKHLRYLAKAGIWQGRIQIGQGHTQKVLENCLVIVRVGRHWQDKPSLIEQLVALAIGRLGCDEILHIAAKGNLSAIELKQLQEQLLEIYPNGLPPADIESERLMFLDMVQRLFTDGGPGGGHLVPRQFIDFERQTGNVNYSSEFEVYMIVVPYVAVGMVHARRDETIAKGNEIYDKLSEIVKISPYERQMQKISSDDIILALPQYRYFLIHYLTPAIDRVSEIRFQHKALQEATVTVLAMQRWRLEKNGYPADLDGLVTAGYLNELPMDPYSNQPLVYKRTDDDFVLYSVGPNFIDDGGESGKDKKGKVRLWADEGDWVFWPARK
jgi:hypothetical protein